MTKKEIEEELKAEEEMKKRFEELSKINKKKKIMVGINKDNKIIEVVKSDFMELFDIMFSKNMINSNEYYRLLKSRAEETMCQEKSKYRNNFIERFNREPKIGTEDTRIYCCWLEDDYRNEDIYYYIQKCHNLKKIIMNGELYIEDDGCVKYKNCVEGEVLNGNF